MVPERDDDLSIREARKVQLRELPDLMRRYASGNDSGDDAEDVSRRNFLRLMGASAGLAGLSGCVRAPDKQMIPYVTQPPEVRPGIPAFYATTLTLDGYGTGVLVESHEGHPTKVEGNPEHPASMGATGAYEQAQVLSLYDPARARTPMHGGTHAAWPAFFDAHASTGLSSQGRGLHFLLEPTSSPMRVELIGRIAQRLPHAQFHFFTPAAREQAWRGAEIAFLKPLETQANLKAARVVLSIDRDFASPGPQGQKMARDFALGRDVSSPADEMNRLYVAEASLSLVGSISDHHFAIRDCDMMGFVAAVAGYVLVEDPNARGLVAELRKFRTANAAQEKWARAVARDLLAHEGASAILVGDGQPKEMHALAHAMNESLGNAGVAVSYTESPIHQAGAASHELAGLVSQMQEGKVDRLLYLGGNPVHGAFADLHFDEQLKRVKEVVYLGAYENETAALATWFLPEAHPLESWGDARAFDGSISTQQPLIRPMYGGRTVDEVLAPFAFGTPASDAHTLLQSMWKREKGDAFERFWANSLRAGVVKNSAFPAVPARVDWQRVHDAITKIDPRPSVPAVEIRFRPDFRVYDGRFANNAWLQELPDPITQITWGNAVIMSAKTMSALGVKDEELVKLTHGGRTLTAVACAAHGHADASVTLTLGYGRKGAESLARDLGFNASLVRTSAAPAGGAVEIARSPGTHALARAQLVFDLVGRDEDVLHQRTQAEYRKSPRAPEANAKAPSLYHLTPTAPRQWGMAIDLTKCTGCSACVVACQAENNVPVVGMEGVRKGRRMHWMRVDRYQAENAGDQLLPEPMLCQHCEMAPCEYVCPVNATVHSADGLNQMTYNRCVGTRFCSNNCPYKVRRFNWFNYNMDLTPVERLVKNPDVTVRARGVMEKCTFCVQRIREKEISEKVSGAPLGDGDVRTACEQACPTGAIVFGDIARKDSRVSAMYANGRTFSILDSLGTKPRTRYLAKLRNPNPELA